MLVVLPVTRADSELAVKLARWISTLGGGANHSLLVAATHQSKEAGEEVINILQGSFATAHTFIPESEHELGWPSSSNFMFQKTAGHLFARGNRLPFYWFEADNVPVKATWLDELQTEYNLAQKPFMGVIEDSCVFDKETRKLLKKDGQHMNGSGIYPANLAGVSQLFNSIHLHKEAQPWDIYLRWEMKGHIHNSKLMLNNWKSEKYVRTADGQIACSAIDPCYPGKYVGANVVVVHGCKDGSLIDLLERERERSPKPTAPKKSK